jgi:hypothetical protein
MSTNPLLPSPVVFDPLLPTPVVFDSVLPSPVLFDLKQSAQILKCSPRWLADGLRAGRLPGRKIQRNWFLTPEDQHEILRLCAVVPKAGPTTDANPLAPQSSSMTPTTARRIGRSGHRC